MKDNSYKKDVPKMFSNDATEFPKDVKVIMVESGESGERPMNRELSKNVMYNVKGNKEKKY